MTYCTVFADHVDPEIRKGSPRARALNETGSGTTVGDFRPLTRRISETVQDRFKVAIDH